MHFPTPTLLLTLCTTLFITTTLAQTTDSNPNKIQCLRFPRTIIGNLTYNPDAITALSTAISDNSLTPQLPSEGIKLRPGYSSRVGWEGSGGFQVCVQNFWFFKTLTVPLKDLADAVAELKNQCCDDGPGLATGVVMGTEGRGGKCQDAKGLVKASDGSSNLKVVSQDFGDRCCGMWGC